ncbi:geranylgeranylglyceryl/heptaprenylglyceryl phosphate synthase [Algoriphagus sp.]|uniref:geranylgeranylglyceryl/heptaprenylglyceryl phosphate synthase n=1 Tax=Algoriphagus sp. TaxID=1872435 RepID=UPI0025BF02F8|nr:geranylgeranylglyceryl/heptaprenylglyceryl phosphate synthase [Algoriphagus sp.]
MSKKIQHLFENQKKGVAWLIDPGKLKAEAIPSTFWESLDGLELDFIFIGGSQDEIADFDAFVRFIKEQVSDIPVVLFPGSHQQVSSEADAILFLSLLSGKNPEYLITQQVRAAQSIKKASLEALPTAYILVNDGEICSVHRKSETLPLLNQDVELIVDTALAGKFLGMDFCYLDAGSGASSKVAPQVIQRVSEEIMIPLIVGGGLTNLQKVHESFEGGADLVVIGNQIEKDPSFLTEVLNLKRFLNAGLHVN